MNSSLIAKIIKENTGETSVDLKGVVAALNIDVVVSKDLTDECKISYPEKSAKPLIQVNAKLDLQTKLTFIAIAVAEYILSPERVSKKGITYDMFFLKSLAEERYSFRMLLATRLAIPEAVMTSINENPSAMSEYMAIAKVRPELVRLCAPDRSLGFILSNFSS